MNKYDWKNAFPKPSENFHNKLCMTLDSLEKENVKMKKISFKKSIIIAAAVLAIGTAAFASRVRLIISSEVHRQSLIIQPFPLRKHLIKILAFHRRLSNNFQTAIHLKADITEKISMLTKKTAQKKSINRLRLIMKKTVTKLC